MAASLRGDGMVLDLAPFAVRIRSDFESVHDHLGTLYGKYSIRAPGEFVDFDIQIQKASGLRRWLRPQATFLLDDAEPFLPLPANQAAPLFEWGLNWSIANRPIDLLVIHAGVLERAGQALILPGAPGSGKSTLCAALATRGDWRLLSDELTLLRPDDGWIIPIPRPVSLKNASIDLIAKLAPGEWMGRVYPDTRKGRLSHLMAPDDAVAKARIPARGTWVVFPRFEADATPHAEPLSRAEALLRMADQSFNREALGADGFRVMCQLMDGADCWLLEYSSTEQALALVDQCCRPPRP